MLLAGPRTAPVTWSTIRRERWTAREVIRAVQARFDSSSRSPVLAEISSTKRCGEQWPPGRLGKPTLRFGDVGPESSPAARCRNLRRIGDTQAYPETAHNQRKLPSRLRMDQGSLSLKEHLCEGSILMDYRNRLWIGVPVYALF
jgi:hypothetical protein